MIFARMKNNNMSENKQIEELAATIYTPLQSDAMSRALAVLLYKEGLRKQSEGNGNSIKMEVVLAPSVILLKRIFGTMTIGKISADIAERR